MDMDMSSFMDWIGWIYLHSNTYVFSVYNYKAKGTEDAFEFQCLPVNRNLFPPLGNLTPQDAESELKLSMGPYVLHLWASRFSVSMFSALLLALFFKPSETALRQS